MLEDRAHQTVFRDQAWLVTEAHRPGDRRLQLERQAVAVRSGLELQGAADPGQELLGSVGPRSFGGAQQGITGDGRRPANRLDVAEPSGSVLEVRLEQMGRDAEPFRPHERVLTQGARERRHVVGRDGADAVGSLTRDRQVAGDGAQVEHRRQSVEMTPGHLLALDGRAHRVSDLEPAVPQRIEEAFRERRHLLWRSPVVHDQQVDVGPRQLLMAAVAADRGEPDAGRRLRRAEQLRQTPSNSSARRLADHRPW